VVRNNKNDPITRSKELQALKSAKVEFADGESRILVNGEHSSGKEKRHITRSSDKAQRSLL